MIRFVKIVVHIIVCRLIYRVRYVNKINEEKLDRCIICPNHYNWADPAYIYTVTKNISVMAKSELFKWKIEAKFLESLNIFPIKRGERDARSLVHAINLMKQDKQKLIIFPEGTRIKGKHSEKEAKVGAAYIAMKTDSPIIPVYISRRAFIFSRINVIYGEPIYLDKTRVKDKEYLQIISNEILDKCYELGRNYGENI